MSMESGGGDMLTDNDFWYFQLRTSLSVTLPLCLCFSFKLTEKIFAFPAMDRLQSSNWNSVKSALSLVLVTLFQLGYVTLKKLDAPSYWRAVTIKLRQKNTPVGEYVIRQHLPIYCWHHHNRFTWLWQTFIYPFIGALQALNLDRGYIGTPMG